MLRRATRHRRYCSNLSERETDYIYRLFSERVKVSPNYWADPSSLMIESLHMYELHKPAVNKIVNWYSKLRTIRCIRKCGKFHLSIKPDGIEYHLAKDRWNNFYF